MTETAADFESPGNGIPLSSLSADSFTEEPHQPRETSEISSLRERFHDFLKNFVAEKKFSTTFDQIHERFAYIYGGESRFYERFLKARKNNIDKAYKMMKDMVQTRHGILGENMVSNIALSGKFEDAGAEHERGLFSSLDSFWPLAYFGFSANTPKRERCLVMAAKLRDINPSVFISKFDKQDIKRFYFHFVEKGNALQRVANSPIFVGPISKYTSTKETENHDLQNVKEEEEDNNSANNTANSYTWKRVIEIYDLSGMSMKQMHISGLLVLKDVLSLGQVCFPENVEKTYLLNVPWFFQAAWSVIKLVIDPATLEKITISRFDCKKELNELLGSEEMVGKMWKHIEEKMKSQV